MTAARKFWLEDPRREPEPTEVISLLCEALDECADYFEPRQDADHDGSGFVPNEEMRLLRTVQEALAKAQAVLP